MRSAFDDILQWLVFSIPEMIRDCTEPYLRFELNSSTTGAAPNPTLTHSGLHPYPCLGCLPALLAPCFWLSLFRIFLVRWTGTVVLERETAEKASAAIIEKYQLPESHSADLDHIFKVQGTSENQ